MRTKFHRVKELRDKSRKYTGSAPEGNNGRRRAPVPDVG
jgi:hypothetical protein